MTQAMIPLSEGKPLIGSKNKRNSHRLCRSKRMVINSRATTSQGEQSISHINNYLCQYSSIPF